MNSADGLQLVGGVENRLNQEHMVGFDQVQPVGPGFKRHQKDFHIFPILNQNNILGMMLWLYCKQLHTVF